MEGLRMRYGYFDEPAREYVIERPNTPESWINYLGTDEFCSIVSNNASGYSFYRSAMSGRMTRFRFNSVPMDRPGRYLYIRDEADGRFWSASWQPVGLSLDSYKSVCRHGLGYSRFIAEYRGIRSELCIFVPIDRPHEVWDVTIANTSDAERKLSLFTYTEWCFWHMQQDLTNFQYILYTCRMGYHDGVIDYSIRLWPKQEPKAFAASTLPVLSYDTDREAFIGPYRDEGSPLAVERGECSNSIAMGGNPCASLHNRVVLAPGATARVTYVAGAGDAKTDGVRYRDEYSDPRDVEREFSRVREYWDVRLNKYTCRTPSQLVNDVVNVWNQYQCHTTFNWSRSASFIEAGGRDGLGYRDTNQDILGVVHSVPVQARARLVDLLKGQLSNGAAMHSVQPLTWTQGPHNIPEEGRIFSDDHLWLLLSVPSYLKETGDMAFLDLVVPYADKGEDTVYDHLKAALEFSWSHRGSHGLLLGLAADWNDCLNLRGNGESVFSTFLFCRALTEQIELSKRLGKNADAEHFSSYLDSIRSSLDTYAWDGNWFLRGYLGSGRKLGSSESEQSKIFLNAQTWAVVSGVASREQAERAMDSVKEMLATQHGLLLNYPAYTEHDIEIGAITDFPPGLKENSSIFCHTNTWAVIAEAMLGRGDRAYEYYLSYLPAARNDDPRVYRMEPYVYCQFITGKEHPYQFGRARNSWLTGTASWSFVAVSQYILGVRADYDGLIVDPCIPRSFEEYKLTREFRGRRFDIVVKNPDRVCHGVKSMTVNGEAVTGNLIPPAMMKDTNRVVVVLGT
jgi:N,N'-diacetylchitobiose phosphorylase